MTRVIKHTHTHSIFFTLRMESKLVEEASLHPLVIILSCVNCLANHLELNVIKIYSRLIWSVMVLRMYGIAFFLNTSPLNQLLDTETRPSTHTLKQIICYFFFFFTEWWLVCFWVCYKSFSAFPTHFSLENTPLYYCYVQNVISEIFDVHSFEHLYNYKYEVWNTAFFRFCLGKQLLLFEKKEYCHRCKRNNLLFSPSFHWEKDGPAQQSFSLLCYSLQGWKLPKSFSWAGALPVLRSCRIWPLASLAYENLN